MKTPATPTPDNSKGDATLAAIAAAQAVNKAKGVPNELPDAATIVAGAQDPKAPGPVTIIKPETKAVVANAKRKANPKQADAVSDAMQAAVKAGASPAEAAAAAADVKPAKAADLEAKVGLRKTVPVDGIVKRTNAFYVDPSFLVRKPGFNPRFDFGEIDLLAKSIKANGLLQPLRAQRTGTGGKFELIDGDRRFTAIEQLIKDGHKFPDGIHVVLVDKDQSSLDSLFQMFESNTGKAFLPLEEAAAYKRMRDAGLTIKQICQRVGRKQVHVVATLALLDADQDVQDAVKDGSVNSTMAKKIAVNARGDKAKQKVLIAAAKSAGKDKKARRTVKAAVEAARVEKAKKQGRVLKIRALTDDQLSALGEKMSEVLLAQMAELGLEAEADLTAWVAAGDLEVKLAFTFGALQALKAGAGVPVTLTF